MARKTGKHLYQGRGQAADADRGRLAWWRDARFGLFIHWGLYAIPAGRWHGEPVEGLGEWIMFNRRIPVTEYERLATLFDPTGFDAERVVELAMRAGMAYLVLTAKHHEGFALFASEADGYNSVDATPSHRDIVGELSSACHRAGLPIGFYYSQDQDWHHPDGSWNDWDYRPEEKRFDRYFRGKVVPQITELLTNYGPVALIWFDTPYTMEESYSRELRDLVHRLQPDCLVSGRVGNDLGDYGSLGDNQIPVGGVIGDYETPATMNDTWGYRSDDEHWKSVDRLLYLLIDLASKGINYLLNIGPDAKGAIPQPSIERLEEIGRWMDAHGDAIRGTSPCPFPWEFSWGRMTVAPGRLFLICFSWPDEPFVLYGIRSRVISVTGPDRKRIGFHQTRVDDLDLDVLTLEPGVAPADGRFPVIILMFDTETGPEIEVDDRLLQLPDGVLSIPAFTGEIVEPDSVTPVTTIASSGFTDEWRDTRTSITFTCCVISPGTFSCFIHSQGPVETKTGVDAPVRVDRKPHEVEVCVDGKPVAAGPLTPDEWVDSPRSQYFPEIRSRIGTVEIAEPGEHQITVAATTIVDGRELSLSAITFEPVHREDGS